MLRSIGWGTILVQIFLNPCLAITLCWDAAESCPAFPAATEMMHWPVADPVRSTGSEPEVMAAFRTARDDIERRVQMLLNERKLLADVAGKDGGAG